MGKLGGMPPTDSRDGNEGAATHDPADSERCLRNAPRIPRIQTIVAGRHYAQRFGRNNIFLSR